AAYRAQLYFDRREALLKHIADSVVAPPGRPMSTPSVSNMGGLRRVPLGNAHDGTALHLLLSTKAENTLDALGAQLLHASSHPGTPVHWLHTPHPAPPLPDVDPSLLHRHALSARTSSRVFWVAAPQDNAS